MENTLLETRKPADTFEKTKNTIEFGIADSMDRALVTITAFVWVEALKSLFIPGGVFARYAVGGPWFAALGVTISAVLFTVYLKQRMSKLSTKELL